MAHENEYAAAVAAMPEHTISPQLCVAEHAVGDRLAFRLHGWGERTYDDGRVIDINEERQRLLVETASDIVEVDPRPWPVGEVLPF